MPGVFSRLDEGIKETRAVLRVPSPLAVASEWGLGFTVAYRAAAGKDWIERPGRQQNGRAVRMRGVTSHISLIRRRRGKG